MARKTVKVSRIIDNKTEMFMDNDDLKKVNIFRMMDGGPPIQKTALSRTRKSKAAAVATFKDQSKKETKIEERRDTPVTFIEYDSYSSEDSEDETHEERANIRKSLAEEKYQENTMDETIRLYNTMPKGLEYFMNFGPPKKFIDKAGLAKVDHESVEAKRKRDQRLEMVQDRWDAYYDKKKLFFDDIKKFEKFITDNKKKVERVRFSFLKNLIEKVNLRMQIIESVPLLQANNERVHHLKKQIALYKPLQNFIDVVLRISNQRTFGDFIVRHNALEFHLRRNNQRFEELQEWKDKLENAQATKKIRHRSEILMLKQSIITKKKALDKAQSEVEVLEKDVEDAGKRWEKRKVEDVLMNRSVANMTNMLATYRPYTEQHLRAAVTSGDKLKALETIGNLIADYGVILENVRGRMSLAKKTTTDKRESKKGGSRPQSCDPANEPLL